MANPPKPYAPRKAGSFIRDPQSGELSPNEPRSETDTTSETDEQKAPAPTRKGK